MNKLPELSAPIVEEHLGVHVVRDDLIAGGTKARYLLRLFAEHERVVYASPAYGGAQLALAYCARATQRQAVIMVAQRKQPHARTLEARAAGARVFQVPHGYLSVVQSKAKLFAEEQGGHYLEFGGESEEALVAIAGAAKLVWDQHGPFDEVWSAAGSGVLTRGLQRGVPESVRFFAVAVGKAVDKPGRATVISSGVPFERELRGSAPFPSCPNYDAKAWAALVQRRTPGARVLFWNVMGPSPTPHQPVK